MEIFTDLNEVKLNKQLVIALGTFDGIHLGHQQIIQQSRELAKKVDGLCAVLTFANHPLSVLAPELEPLHILSNKGRRLLLSEMGVDILLEIPFTVATAELTAAEFVDFVKKTVNPLAITVGDNFTFGKGAGGDAATLESLCRLHGIRTTICPTVTVDSQTVSSTRIRSAIKEGNLTETNRCLGYDYFICGKVIHGDERGRLLGFPTANLFLDAGLAHLPDGAYAVRIDVKTDSAGTGNIGKSQHGLYGIANIGSNPTFNGEEKRLEAHIFDFAADIYGRTIAVSFVARLRGEVKFASAGELKIQLKKDKAKAKQLLSLK